MTLQHKQGLLVQPKYLTSKQNPGILVQKSAPELTAEAKSSNQSVLDLTAAAKPFKSSISILWRSRSQVFLSNSRTWPHRKSKDFLPNLSTLLQGRSQVFQSISTWPHSIDQFFLSNIRTRPNSRSQVFLSNLNSKQKPGIRVQNQHLNLKQKPNFLMWVSDPTAGARSSHPT